MAVKNEKRKIAVIDCETDPFKPGRIPKPFLWGFFDGEQYKSFPDSQKLLDFIFSCKEKYTIYAHNGGKFDFHFLLKHIKTDTPINMINGRLVRFSIKNIEFRDSFAIIPVPLSAYQKTKVNYKIFEADKRENARNKKVIAEYLKDDCVFLYTLVTDFIERFGKKLTTAGTALSQWQKISGESAPKTTKYFFDKVRPYYFGGRVSVFKAGTYTGLFSAYDINSAYPDAMCYDHPYGNTFSISPTIPSSGVEKTFIKIKCIAKGCFPFREKNKLSFPSDEIERIYFITGWEYLAAKKLKLIEKEEIIHVLVFPEKINFKKYVTHWFKEKKEAKKAGDRAREIFSKLMLNGLYGKFASNPQNYRDFMLVHPGTVRNRERDGWQLSNLIDDHALIEKPLEEIKQRYYNIATGASITGFVRAHLLNQLSQCDPFYCDTDCIIGKKFQNLKIGDNIGEWSHEGDFRFGAFAGRKMYAILSKSGKKWKTASKGVRMTAEEIVTVAKGDTFSFQPEVPTFSIKTGVKFTSRKVRKT